ncbi:hypothetical protein BKI52_12595 [marine bacterium AO1-C]|nr:hypothetical protein BKI52_12595 [marine bacterium AO1-C]
MSNTFRIYRKTHDDKLREFLPEEYCYKEAHLTATRLNKELSDWIPYRYHVCPSQSPVFPVECIFQIKLDSNHWIGELTRDGTKIHVYAIEYTNEDHTQNVEPERILREEEGGYLDMPVSNAQFLMKVLQIEIAIVENKL